MTSFKKILVPVDFSKHSERAVQMAAEIARRYGGTLDIVHVYDPVAYALPDDYALFTPQQIAQLLAEFGRRLTAMKELGIASGAPQALTHLRRGPCVADLVEFARDGAFDLIVMGTHGRSGFSRLLMGSVAERVLRSAPCPVLTVRDEGALSSPQAEQAGGAQPGCCS